MATKEQNGLSVKAFKNFIQPSNTLRLFQTQLKAYVIERYKWENLPPEVDASIIEESLYTTGSVGFYFDEQDQTFYTLPAVPSSGNFDVYGRPTGYMLTTKNGDYRQSFKDLIRDVNFVLIKNNSDMSSTEFFVNSYAAQLGMLRTIQANNIMKTAKPFIIEGTQKTLKDSLKMYADIYNLEDVIVSSSEDTSGGMLSNIKVHDIKFDPQTQIQMDYFNFLKYECLTELGINNTGHEKKERLLVDEVNANNMQVCEGLAAQMIRQRQEAVDKINELYGLDIKISIRKIEEVEPIEQVEEGVEDVN